MAGEDDKYLMWIRLQPCSQCGAPPPSHPHHHTARRPYGKRAHDHDSMPLCMKCHRKFHDARGPFEGWARDDRNRWQSALVEALRASYADISDPEVF